MFSFPVMMTSSIPKGIQYCICLMATGMFLIASCTPGIVATTEPTTDLVEMTISPVPTRTPLPTLTPAPPSMTPSSTPTPDPTATPSASPSATVTPTPTALPASAHLGPLNHQWQTLNNCHRASIAILMGYYDVWFTQHDYNLGMDNLAEFVADYGLTARVYAMQYSPQPASRIVRWLLAEGIPVIVGQDLSGEDPTWHYRVAYGYSDAAQEILLDDPLLGANLRLSYETFNKLARGEGQIIPVYPIELDEHIQSQMRAWEMKLIKYPQ